MCLRIEGYFEIVKEFIIVGNKIEKYEKIVLNFYKLLIFCIFGFCNLCLVCFLFVFWWVCEVDWLNKRFGIVNLWK